MPNFIRTRGKRAENSVVRSEVIFFGGLGQHLGRLLLITHCSPRCGHYFTTLSKNRTQKHNIGTDLFTRQTVPPAWLLQLQWKCEHDPELLFEEPVELGERQTHTLTCCKRGFLWFPSHTFWILLFQPYQKREVTQQEEHS